MTDTLVSKTTIKGQFQTGDQPTQSQYDDWITTVVAEGGYDGATPGAIQIGTSSVATGGPGVMAIGGYASGACGCFAVNGSALGTSAIALGHDGGVTYASGSNAFALGLGRATQPSSLAFGSGAMATASPNAIAIGGYAKAGGTASLAIGVGATTLSNASLAIGSKATANACAIAIGSSATAGGTIAMAVGNGAQASGDTSLAIGSSSTSLGNSFALGQNTYAPIDGFVFANAGSAVANGGMQFGSGTNDCGTSLAIGTGGIRICGAGDPAAVVRNGDIWVDVGGYVCIRSNGTSVQVVYCESESA